MGGDHARRAVTVCPDARDLATFLLDAAYRRRDLVTLTPWAAGPLSNPLKGRAPHPATATAIVGSG
jgi:hypothetical protein